MKTLKKYTPGFLMALAIAAAAKGLEALEGLAGLHLIGASVIALFIGMGINTSFAQMKKSGAAPMLHGFIISLLVVLVAIAVEYIIGVAPRGSLF